MASYIVTNKNLQFDTSYCIVFRGVHQYKIMVYTSETLVRLDQA